MTRMARIGEIMAHEYLWVLTEEKNATEKKLPQKVPKEKISAPRQANQHSDKACASCATRKTWTDQLGSLKGIVLSLGVCWSQMILEVDNSREEKSLELIK